MFEAVKWKSTRMPRIKNDNAADLLICSIVV